MYDTPLAISTRNQILDHFNRTGEFPAEIFVSGKFLNDLKAEIMNNYYVPSPLEFCEAEHCEFMGVNLVVN